MPRIRTIKPDAWQDRKVGELSHDARLLWVVLITMADDAGRFRTHTGTVWGHGYMHEPSAMTEIPAWLDELAEAGLIRQYESGGEAFGCLPSWASHQRISKPTPSRIPEPPRESQGIPGVPPSPPRDSRAGREGKGEEGKGKEGSSAPAVVPPPPAMPERADECARLLDEGGVVLLDAYFLVGLTEQHPDVDFAEVARAVVRKHRAGGLTAPASYLRGIVTSDNPPKMSRLRAVPSEFEAYGRTTGGAA